MGVGGYLHLEKQVTVSVDGQTRTLGTFAGSVGHLLDQAGVEIGPHDKVTPDVEAPITDGMRIEVLLAKEVTLVLNGESRNLYVTGQTVEEVLGQINIRTGNRAYVRPSRGATIQDGDTIVYREAVGVKVKVDGKERQIITNAPDVGYLLDSLGVVLHRRDKVDPGIREPLRTGMAVRVTRVALRRVVEHRTIPFETEIRKTNDMLEGERRVTRAGDTGTKRVVYEVVVENGKEKVRRQLDQTMIEEPSEQIVLVGTREPRTQQGQASWYDRSGMTAAHRWIAFGTRVHVTNLANGRSVTVVIDDRGPYIDGRIIDLSDEAYEKLAPLSSGTINVRIAW